MVSKTFCDRCGKEERVEQRNIPKRNTVGFYYENYGRTDLCEECRKQYDITLFVFPQTSIEGWKIIMKEIEKQLAVKNMLLEPITK